MFLPRGVSRESFINLSLTTRGRNTDKNAMIMHDKLFKVSNICFGQKLIEKFDILKTHIT